MSDTIPGRLRHAAQTGRGELIFHLEEGPRRVSAQELWDMAIVRAQALRERGVGRGDNVGLIGPNQPEWAAWAFGIWAAGATLVPLPFPLGIRDHQALAQQVNKFVVGAACKEVICQKRFASLFPEELVQTWDEPLPTASASIDMDSVKPHDAAVIQFTSGSTGSPKGVVLEHDRIIYSVRMGSTGIEVSPSDRFVGWAPLFHDLGLFGYLLRPMLEGCEGHILPTERFARDPAEWFRVITRSEGTITTAPSSGYAVALKGIERDPAGFDLSSMRCAVFGAELMDPEVVDRFREVGGRVGLDHGAVAGSYGMAEATLTISIEMGGVRMETLDVARMTQMRAKATIGTYSRRVCSCGYPIPGLEARIADGGEVLEEGRIGEIELRSYGLMRGYLGVDPSQSFSDGWFSTGDLGFLSRGELFVTGRMKDVVIVMGRTYAPEDIEWATARVPSVRPGRCVAFGRPGGKEGEVVIALEVREGADPAAVPAEVRRTVAASVGMTPTEVLVLPTGTVPKTTSGKLRRGALRDAYARQEVDVLA